MSEPIRSRPTPKVSGQTTGWRAVVVALAIFGVLALACAIAYVTDSFKLVGAIFAGLGSIAAVLSHSHDAISFISRRHKK